MRLRVSSMYRSWTDTSLFEYLAEHGFDIEAFAFYPAPRSAGFSDKPALVRLYLWSLLKLCLSFHRYRRTPILSIGGHYPWMVLTRVFGRLLPREYHLYLWNFYLHDLGENRIVRAILRFLLASKRITVIAQSPRDFEYFAELSSNKPFFVPYGEDDFQAPAAFELVPDYPYLFAGGYSNRDYGIVFSCARAVPGQRFVVVASRLNKDFTDGDAPPNVMIYRDIAADQFQGLLERADALIIPLKNNVGSSGQMVCVAGMRRSKPIIYADIPAINYFFDDRCGIPYRMGDPESLERAVRKLQGLTADEISEMGEHSRKRFLQRYTRGSRNEKLAEIVRRQGRI